MSEKPAAAHSVKLEAPVKLRSMGYQTRLAQGYALHKMQEKDSQWPDVKRRIATLKTSVFHYDEAQDVFLTANRNEVKAIRSTWKSLMTNHANPVVVVLSGTNDLQPYGTQAGIANGLQPEDYERLIHAAGRQFGWTYARALDGIAEVLAAGGDTLTRLALAHAYDRAGNSDPTLNIFVVDYWRNLLPDAGLLEEVIPEKRRVRPRKEQSS